MTYIPSPTIPSALSVLYDMEKKFHHSFPYNRYGPKKDKYTFSRVRIPLIDLIDTITQYSHYFVSASLFPPSLFTFLDQVTHFAHRLPMWDNEENNQSRRDLYNDLSLFWKQAILSTYDKVFNGHCSFPPDTISNWAKSLANHNTLANGLLDEPVHDFTRCFLFNSPTINHHHHHSSMMMMPSSSSTNHHHPSSSSTSLDNTTTVPPVCHSPALDMLPSPVVSYAYLQR
ncbi:unnamed protein product [Cunninghamella echinulata]